MLYDKNAMTVNTSGKVESIKVELVIRNTRGSVKISDLLLQGGNVATEWTSHPAELKWSLDG